MKYIQNKECMLESYDILEKDASLHYLYSNVSRHPCAISLSGNL